LTRSSTEFLVSSKQNSKSRRARSARLPSRQKRRNGRRARPTNAVAAYLRGAAVGLPDMQSHNISWVAGSVYVGNGTLGVANSVYFGNTAGTTVFATAGRTPFVPIAAQDGNFGATYAKAIFELYRRVRYRAIRVHFIPLQSSTANNLTLTAAPIRGAPGFHEVAAESAGTPDAFSQAAAMSMNGSQTRDSFEQLDLDLTPYIAGGSGAKQNEFDISGEDGKISGDETSLYIGRIPACFVVSGNSTVAALQGTVTHYVVVEAMVDLFDFTGATPVLNVL